MWRPSAQRGGRARPAPIDSARIRPRGSRDSGGRFAPRCRPDLFAQPQPWRCRWRRQMPPPAKCCARLPDRRDRLRSSRRRSPTCIPRTVMAGIVETPLAVRFPRRGPTPQAAIGTAAARCLPDHRRLPAAFTFRLKARIRAFRRRPGLRGSGRELVAGLRLQPQAPLRPALEEPEPVPWRRPDPRPVGAAPAGLKDKALPLRRRGRGPARARPLHLPGAAGRTLSRASTRT